MKTLTCRNCNTVITIGDRDFQKVLKNSIEYKNGLIPCISCSDGAVFDVFNSDDLEHLGVIGNTIQNNKSFINEEDC